MASAGIMLMSTPMVSACHSAEDRSALDSAAISCGSSLNYSLAIVPNMSDYITSADVLSNTYQMKAYSVELLNTPKLESATSMGEQVAELALQYVGYRYVYGGKSPSRGFDCSGFVYYVYKQFGYNLSPGARNQWSILGNRVSRGDLQPGDIVFFSRNGKASGIFHVGIYIGNNRIVHASTKRSGVKISNLSSTWYSSRYYGAKRVFN